MYVWCTQMYYFKCILRYVLVNLFTYATSTPNTMKCIPKTQKEFVSPFLLIMFPNPLPFSHASFRSGMFSQGLVPIFGLLVGSGSFEIWDLVGEGFTGEFPKGDVRYSFSLSHSWLKGKLEIGCAINLAPGNCRFAVFLSR